MIVATREGQIIHQDPLTQEQVEMLWGRVFSAFLALHPEEITGGQDAAVDSTPTA